MTDPNTVTVFHAPQTRSSGTLILLEELGAPYELHVLDLKAGEQRQPAFLAINPLGKVPAIRHRGELVTEQVAISLYLADEFPNASLAPAIGDPLRGSYLRWFVFYAACYEPALIDNALKREPAPLAMSPYGSFDAVLAAVRGALEDKPYLLGDRPFAVDVLWGQALRWAMAFKMLPDSAVIGDYVARITSRPAALKVAAIDAELAEAHSKASS